VNIFTENSFSGLSSGGDKDGYQLVAA